MEAFGLRLTGHIHESYSPSRKKPAVVLSSRTETGMEAGLQDMGPEPWAGFLALLLTGWMTLDKSCCGIQGTFASSFSTAPRLRTRMKSSPPLLPRHSGLAAILSTSRQQLPLVVRKGCTPQEDILKAAYIRFLLL